MRRSTHTIAKLVILLFGVVGIGGEETYFAIHDLRQDRCISAIPRPTQKLPAGEAPSDPAKAVDYYSASVDYWDAQVIYQGKIEECYQ